MPGPNLLEQLYDAHAQALYGFLLNFTRNEADTQDLLQELLLKLAQRPEMLESVRDLRAFLLRLAHNLAVDLMRRRSTRDSNYTRLATESFSLFIPSPDPDERAFGDRLTEAMGELPPGQRAVMHLKLWEERTFEENAELLGISPNTAASRYRYGLDKLRERLRPIYDEIIGDKNGPV